MTFRLVSYVAPDGNVGDDYSRWLFSLALGEDLRSDGEILLFGVGSILTSDFEEKFRDERIRACTVFGSGARGPDDLPKLSEGSWSVFAVRGPLTARVANIPCADAVADPGILAPRLIDARADAEGPVGIVPYFSSSELAWTRVANHLGWNVISPKSTVENFMAAIAKCSRVWCESMHGAIFADAYGVPWRPISATSVAAEGRTHAFKWTDWTASMGLGFDPLGGLPFPDHHGSTLSSLKESIKIELMSNYLYRADKQDRHLLSNRNLLSLKQEELFYRINRMSRYFLGRDSNIT
jgi:succinoglycan biosynthesis protein ExoV